MEICYIVDAWLERADPRITVCSAHNGSAVLDWDQHTIHKLFASGALSPEDFRPSSSQELWELLCELFYWQNILGLSSSPANSRQEMYGNLAGKETIS
ncbi:hypothetical protein [Candidatus Magnetaquicoccus inordinatus]|uniref:hypothetical protein n=1 Tax=Candidatus Magnetaquicoccus inordinatus TaxID=2496818 RepID=UPI00102C9EDB|nr:hypothetical protein [Candidatus Magnetaquicoccus inordinatus]